MKALILLTVLSATFVSSPAIMPKRVSVPAPKSIHITKKSGKFLKFM